MSEGIPIDNATLSKLMNTPIIIRMATILDITSLSILELLEYDINLGDIIFAIANGVVTYDNEAIIASSEYDITEIVPNANLYYSFVRRKVKLTKIGLYILESIKGNQFTRAGE
ncbi:MAG TPA: hypothetical protein VFG90_00890, partial [Nitrososphaeraceae archaeon]|nr:hypothetical protein [Nitrososphaeraceae archaeon]